jgi:hypothetical protein
MTIGLASESEKIIQLAPNQRDFDYTPPGTEDRTEVVGLGNVKPVLVGLPTLCLRGGRKWLLCER